MKIGSKNISNNMLKLFKKHSGVITVVLLTAFVIQLVYGPVLLNFPFKYSGDAVSIFNRINLVVTGEWAFLGIPSSTKLAAPFGFSLEYFPMPNFGFWLNIKFFSLFSSNPFFIYNLSVIASYFLASLGMYFVLRQLKIEVSVAIMVAIVFSFIPFHFSRIGHFNYIFYFYLPYVVYLTLLIFESKSFYYDSSFKVSFGPKLFLTFIALFFLSSINFYYAFFTVFFIGVATVSAFVKYKNKSVIIIGFLLSFVVIASFLVGSIPYKIKQSEYTASVARESADSVRYGLKPSTLILPVDGHRIQSLADFRDEFRSHPLSNENDMANLGALGGLGFLVLLFSLLKVIRKDDFLVRLSTLNIFAILLATVGGGSAVFAVLVSPDIRGYNRISIFIAVFSLFAIAYILNKYLKEKRKILVIPLVFSLGMLAVLDQTPKHFKLSINAEEKEKFISDKEFVQNLELFFENHMQPTIYQYPFMPYPEAPRKFKLHGYDQLADTLHSNTLKWTGVSVKGTKSASYHEYIDSLDLQSQLDYIFNSKYSGLIVYNTAFSDSGEHIHDLIQEKYRIKPVFSSSLGDKTLYAIPRSAVEMGFSFPHFLGLWSWEGEQHSFAWAKRNAGIEIEMHDAPLLVEFKLGTYEDRNVEIYLNEVLLDSIELKSGQFHKVKINNFIKGDNFIEMVTDKKSRRPGNGDPREISFNISEFKLVSALAESEQ